MIAHSPDVQINIPPRRDAKTLSEQHGNAHLPPVPRDENLRQIRKHGRAHWKRASGYHRRALAETAMFHLNTFIGDHLSCRRLDTQTTQARIRCRILNRVIPLGKPQSYKVP